jgi:hypothetical protein
MLQPPPPPRLTPSSSIWFKILATIVYWNRGKTSWTFTGESDCSTSATLDGARAAS